MTRKPVSKNVAVYQKKIGNRLKELRLKAGYASSESFAYENDISRTQFGKYEAGGNIQISTLIKILNSLDVSLAEFFKDFK